MDGSGVADGSTALQSPRQSAHVTHEGKSAVLKRLSRLEGQVRGVARMVEEERYCVDILTQTAAVRAALKAVERLILETHAGHCIEEAIASGNVDDQREKFKELIALLQKGQG
ncbi:MAG: metal-sensitive transcriptional regulator [Pseudomonadota bacterium]